MYRRTDELTENDTGLADFTALGDFWDVLENVLQDFGDAVGAVGVLQVDLQDPALRLLLHEVSVGNLRCPAKLS